MTTAKAALREHSGEQDRASERPRRGTRAEQRVVTRLRLLDATIDCLHERGYANTTTLEVQARAGVSRGTLLHQFPSRTELLTAAIEHLAVVRFAAFREEALAVPNGAQGFDAAIDVLARVVTRPESRVAIELWTASRTAPELVEPMRRHEVFARTQIVALFDELVGSHVRADPRYPAVREAVIYAVAGLAVAQHLRTPHFLEAAVERWKELGRDLGRCAHVP